MNKIIVSFALALAVCTSASASETARCVKRTPSTPGVTNQRCQIVESDVAQRVQVTPQLWATYANYTRGAASGIRVTFHSGAGVLRVVNLSFTESDRETDAEARVDLRTRVPMGSLVLFLDFEGVEESLTLRAVYLDENNKYQAVTVFEAN